jgi:hypothetical protein
MKRKLPLAFLGLIAAGSASAQGLYYVGNDTNESLPLKWVVGTNVIYDDNVSPGTIDSTTGNAIEDSSGAINPYVGLSFVNVTPQTTWDVYVRLGLIYYFDAPNNMDEVSSQSRAGINLTHRFNERLRFSSRNFISYELEPDYSYGYASARSVGEYFFWQTDNSIGYRWSERVATYTGLSLSGTEYADVANNDRFTWQLFNQFRYQLSPQTVLTADYRYGQTTGSGVSSDSSDQFFLAGVEHRFSPNTIGILRAGVQLRDVDQGSNNTSPYLEFAFDSQVNRQFRVRAFTRYGMEYYNTVQQHPTAGLVEFDDRQTLRFGLNGEYAFSPMLSLFGGVDYIPSSYSSGRSVSSPPFLGAISDLDEQIVNGYIGFSVKFNEFITGNASYNYTHSSSDLAGGDYDRNRISLGVSAEF